MSTASAKALACLMAAAIAGAAACGSSNKSDKKSASPTSTGPAIGGIATQGGPIAFPAPPADQVASLVAKAGLALEHHESLHHHVHAHMDVFIDGQHRTIPGGIGIVITEPGVQTGQFDGQPAYGGIANCDNPCISPLHTHDVSGVLHTESATDTDNTLGQFFTEWNVALDGNCVGTFCQPATPLAVYVDGKSVPMASAAAIPLTDHKEIAVIIGTPPAQIPSAGDFSAA